MQEKSRVGKNSFIMFEGADPNKTALLFIKNITSILGRLTPEELVYWANNKETMEELLKERRKDFFCF